MPLMAGGSAPATPICHPPIQHRRAFILMRSQLTFARSFKLNPLAARQSGGGRPGGRRGFNVASALAVSRHFSTDRDNGSSDDSQWTGRGRKRWRAGRDFETGARPLVAPRQNETTSGSDSCVAKVVRTHVRICLPSLEAKTDDFSVQLVSSRAETRTKTAEAAREARLNVQS